MGPWLIYSFVVWASESSSCIKTVLYKAKVPLLRGFDTPYYVQEVHGFHSKNFESWALVLY